MRQLPLAVLSLVAVAPLYAADAPKTWEGLEQRPVKGLDLVYVRPGAQLQGYKSILIDTPVEVAFDRNWDPNEGVRSTTRRMSASDIQAIKTEMAAEFHKVFADELAKGGYALVDQVRDDTLRLHAQIANVFINAPDRMEPGRVTSYTMESGRATLELELRDGATGQLLARVVDEKTAPRSGTLQVTNSVTNSADFRQAVRSWARRLVKELDSLNGKP